MKTVLEVYQAVLRQAQDFRENDKSDEGQAIAQNLYWVSGLLEETKEVNPDIHD